MSEISDALSEPYTARENKRLTGQFGVGSANGKGDKPRPTEKGTFDENFDAINFPGVTGGTDRGNGRFRKTY